MKKKFLLLLICALIAFGSFDAAAYPAISLTEEEALIISFESTGADVLESTISCWAKLNDSFLDTRQLEALMAEVLKHISLDQATIVKNVETDGRLNKLVLRGSKEKKFYNIAIESANLDSSRETYIVVDVAIDNSYKALSTERKVIADALQAAEGSLNFSSCIIGTYKGKLSEGEADKKSRIALQAINARKIEGIENDELKSISAFSSSIGGYTMPYRSGVNVQLAVRYSSYDDKTYIWIGTPLIPVEY